MRVTLREEAFWPGGRGLPPAFRLGDKLSLRDEKHEKPERFVVVTVVDEVNNAIEVEDDA